MALNILLVCINHIIRGAYCRANTNEAPAQLHGILNGGRIARMAHVADFCFGRHPDDFASPQDR